MIDLQDFLFFTPLLLIGVCGFAPYFILHRFKQPFNFLKYYIVIFQVIILYFQLTAKDYLNNLLIPLYQAVILNPTRFWYVILYIIFNLVLIILYLHPKGKQKIRRHFRYNRSNGDASILGMRARSKLSSHFLYRMVPRTSIR